MNKKLLLVTLLCVAGYTMSAQQNMAALNAQLIEAAKNGNKNEITELLANGASVNAQNQIGTAALILATNEGHTDCLELLLNTPSILVNTQNQYGYTALMIAALNGKTNCLQLLLNTPGILVNIQDDDGLTPLMSAASNGQNNCLQLLLNTPGIQVNVQAQQGYTALMVAALKGKPDCVQSLLAVGALRNTQDNAGNTAYDYAVQNGHQAIVELFLEHEGM
ncbi:ankyrin repeat domain-containing protein [Candidatus Babeliales bacterium]|nr:ankyrin repeat domain-containing protein [Candidatus Babeliales bacterium]